MQHVAGFLLLALVALQTVFSSNNSSVLLKRCPNSACLKSKSAVAQSSKPFLGILKKYKLKKVKVIRVVTTTPEPDCPCLPLVFCGNVIAIGKGIQVIDLRSRRCGGQINACCGGQVNACCSYPVTMIPPTTTTRMLPTIATAPITTTTTTARPAPCYCVPLGQCPYYPLGQIDPRYSYCGNPGMVCCQTPVAEPSCYCRPQYQCTGTGYYQIDPRFYSGSSCGASTVMCCNRAGTAAGLTDLQPDPNAIFEVKNVGTQDACKCVKSWQCAATDTVVLDALSALDPRFGLCSNSDEVCCKLQRSAAITASNANVEIIGAQTVQTPFIINGPTPAATPPPGSCGKRGTAPPNTNPSSETTYFAEFPWMVALLLRQPGMNDQLLCGASMINTRAVLTAAHCIFNRPSGVLVARFGEWDTRFTNGSLPYQEANVKTISTHPQYNSVTLYFDVAVLILDKAVNLAGNVQPICLPSQGMVFSPGTRCWASGWGRNAFGNTGQYQSILKKVDLPIVDNNNCQQSLRSTRLGPYFTLHGTFICAGGEQNKDTCQGDGGGPLFCPAANGQFIQAGIISWGIGCGSSSVPAVYASVAQLRTWINQQLANYGAN